ncbi:transcriptional regulator, LysR family [Marinobacter antarcticus]|uniref:Transcriptional regulator, LysR family n=1 Tax=Marinobacter antarcticus TaxID=564117 RepID=A0A1M6Q1S4_9GAMM|nr:LysR substrate-binding domain-containing protein [Marinobacter antarcticus]SHK14077.1 transcriptional regulator, LysR family [Marinobacter antarcticus]
MKNLRSIDLNLLTVFEAVMEHGSLSAAAVKLGMTQSAVSQALSRLRLTLGDEVFVRYGNGMRPSNYAVQIYPEIRQALSTIRAAVGSKKFFDPDNSERNFKLAMGDYGEHLLLPELLRVFARHEGALTVQNHPNTDPDVVAKLEQAQLDLLFDVRPPTSSTIESCELLTEELVVICSADHPRLTGSLSMEQFLSERHVVLAIGDGSHTLLERIPGMQLIENRRIAARVNQYVAIPRLVEATDAIATLPRRMADYFMEREAIRILPFPFEGAIFDVFMAWHRSSNGDAAHTWLREAVKDLAQRL